MVVDNAPHSGPPRLGEVAVVPGAAERALPVVDADQIRMLPRPRLNIPLLSANEREDPPGWYERALRDDGFTPGLDVQRLAVTSLSTREREETRGFTRHTLERMDGRVRPFALPADRYTWAPSGWSVLVKTEQRVVSHAGILYRVVQVGEQRLAVGGIGSVMTLPDSRGRGYARAALKKAEAFVAVWLWAPFALAMCPRDQADFYRKLGWQVSDGPITCEQPGGRVILVHEVAVALPCQGDALWPSGPIDLCGVPW